MMVYALNMSYLGAAKKSTSFALIFLLACSLTACKDSTGENSTGPDSAGTAGNAASTMQQEAGKQETEEQEAKQQESQQKAPSKQIHVTTTVNIITDLAEQIGGDRVQVTGLMGAGVDPHLYKASAGDVQKLSSADLVLYGGHHLEGKMVELLHNNPKSLAVMEKVPEDQLIFPPGGFDGNKGMPDPHLWFDVSLWKYTIPAVRDAYIALDPEGRDFYTNNAEKYMAQLDDLDKQVKEMIDEIPERKRVLVTAHDAFNYYGRRYGLEVKGIQGLSTAVEAGTRDVQDVVNFMISRDIPAIFVESSVPRRTVNAVVNAAAAKGHTITVGGQLYSDALGEPGTPGGTYIGMVLENTKTISEALKR